MNLKTTAFSFVLIFMNGTTPAWSQIQDPMPVDPDSYPAPGSYPYSPYSGEESFPYSEGGPVDQPIGSGMSPWSPGVDRPSCDDCAAGAGACDDCAAGAGACDDCAAGGGACAGGCGGILSRLLTSHGGCGLLGGGGCGLLGGQGCGLFGGQGGGLLGGRGGGWRFWADAEYLLWWSKERFVPTLATTSPQGTPQADAGVRGLPTTSVLYGDDLIGGDAQSGYRGSAGFWFDRGQTTGLGVRYFYVGDENDGFFASSLGDPILARPFFNADPLVLAEDALLVAYPGSSTGAIDIEATNRAQGGDLFLRQLLLSGYCNRLDLIGGYQRTDLDDAVLITHSLVSQDPAGLIAIGTQIDSQDRFQLENQFDGGFIGLMAEAEDGSLTWRLMSKVGFGNMKQSYTVSGTTVTTVPGGPTSVADNGLLALPTNIGFASRDTFAIVPELNVSVGYKLTPRLQLTAGYSFIYWSNVVLAGDIIDTTINPTQDGGPLVGAARPTVDVFDDDFWYQGVSLGVNLRF